MSKQKQLILPRKDEEGNYYISYSQITKWKKSKRDYIRSYFFGEREDNAALQKYGDFGHKVGESYEHKDFSAWSKEEADFLKGLPHLDEFERKIKLDMGGYYVLGFIDSNTAEQRYKKENLDTYVKELLDYKTGEVVKRKPDYESGDYWQVDIYAAALQQEYGKYPDKGSVVLIGRSGNAFKGEELSLSFNHAIIDRPISKERCDKVLAEVQQIAEEISSYYQLFLKLTSNE